MNSTLTINEKSKLLLKIEDLKKMKREKSKESEIVSFEIKLALEFPSTYRHFLLNLGSVEVNGFRILGLATAESKMTVVEATKILRNERPDLPEKLVAISFHPFKDKVLCLDLTKLPNEDCPLVETTLKTVTRLIPINDSFEQWLKEAKDKEKLNEKFLASRRRLENRQREILRRIIEKEIDKRFGKLCPLCRRDERRPLVCSNCYKNYLNETWQEVELIDWLQKKLEERNVKLPKFTTKNRKEIPHVYLRPQDWHCRTIRVHDYVVINTAFRWNYHLNSLEVDECWSAIDDPRFPPQETTKNLMMLLFSMSLDFGGSINLAFTKDIREDELTGEIKEKDWKKISLNLSLKIKKEADNNNGRIRRPIPQKINELAQKYNITFKKAEQGIVEHKEGVELFLKLFEFPKPILEKINKLVKAGYFTKEALGYVLAAGIWTKEEVSWLLVNAPRPEAIIFGSATPENRLYYIEAINYGRAVYLMTLLKKKIMIEITDGLPDEQRKNINCKWQTDKKGRQIILRCNKGYHLPWMIEEKKVYVKPGAAVLVYSLPKLPTNKTDDGLSLAYFIDYLGKIKINSEIRCLLLSFEYSDLKYGMENDEVINNISYIATQKGVYLLFSPYRTEILNEEIDERMNRARKIRHFPVRQEPLELEIHNVPKEVWEEPAMKFSVEDALSAASWIANSINIRLGRKRFNVNCSCIERIATQDQRCRKIGEISDEESLELIKLLRLPLEITPPFVQPEEMEQFLKKSEKNKETLNQISGGIVVIPYYFSYFKSHNNAEPTIKPATTNIQPLARLDLLDTVKLENNDFSNFSKKRQDELLIYHQQIKKALKTEQPLTVSYFRHELFPLVIRDYLYYPTTYFNCPIVVNYTIDYSEDLDLSPPRLRIVYNDNTEGIPFPLFCLPDPELNPRPDNFYKINIGTISMRHADLDLITEGYLIQNMMIKKKETCADQEDYAYRRTWHFLTNFIDLVRHQRVEEITEEIRFKYLWQWLKLEEKEYNGCELHLFQTGLEPAVVGIFHAIVDYLRMYGDNLIVVPRIINPQVQKNQIISENDYLKLTEWR